MFSIRFAFVSVPPPARLPYAKCHCEGAREPCVCVVRQDVLRKLTINIKFNWLHGQWLLDKLSAFAGPLTNRHQQRHTCSGGQRPTTALKWGTHLVEVRSLSLNTFGGARALAYTWERERERENGEIVSAFDVRSINTLADQFNLDKSISGE